MSGPIVHLDELEFTRDTRHGERFEAKVAPVAPVVGARKLGYNVTSVPPGKRAFPFHNHHANEEMFFILEGEGTLRFGAAAASPGGRRPRRALPASSSPKAPASNIGMESRAC